MNLKVMRVLAATLLCFLPWILGIEARPGPQAPLFLDKLLSNPKLKSAVSSSTSSSTSSGGFFGGEAPKPPMSPDYDDVETSYSQKSSYSSFPEEGSSFSNSKSFSTGSFSSEFPETDGKWSPPLSSPPLREPSPKTVFSSYQDEFDEKPDSFSDEFQPKPLPPPFELPPVSAPQLPESGVPVNSQPPDFGVPPQTSNRGMLPASVIAKSGYPSSMESFKNGPPSRSMFDLNAPPPIMNSKGPLNFANPASLQLSNPPLSMQSVPQSQSYAAPAVSSSFGYDTSSQFQTNDPVKDPDYDDLKFSETEAPASLTPEFSSSSFSDDTDDTDSEVTSETVTDESDTSYSIGGPGAPENTELPKTYTGGKLDVKLYEQIMEGVDEYLEKLEEATASESNPDIQDSSPSDISPKSGSSSLLSSGISSEPFNSKPDFSVPGSDTDVLESSALEDEDSEPSYTEIMEQLAEYGISDTDIESADFEEEDSEYTEIMEQISEYESSDTDIESTDLGSSSGMDNPSFTSSDATDTESLVSEDSSDFESELESSMLSELSKELADSYSSSDDDSSISDSPSGTTDDEVRSESTSSEAQNAPMSTDTKYSDESELEPSSVTDGPSYTGTEISDTESTPSETEDFSEFDSFSVSELESMLRSELGGISDSDKYGFNDTYDSSESDSTSSTTDEEGSELMPLVSEVQDVSNSPEVPRLEEADSKAEKTSTLEESSTSDSIHSDSTPLDHDVPSKDLPSATKSQVDEISPSQSATPSLSSTTLDSTKDSPKRTNSETSRTQIPATTGVTEAQTSSSASTSESASSTSLSPTVSSTSLSPNNTSSADSQTNSASAVAGSSSTKSNANSDATSNSTSAIADTDSKTQKSTTPIPGMIQSTFSAVSSSTVTFSNGSSTTVTRNVTSQGRPSSRTMIPGFARSFASARAGPRRRVEPKRIVCYFNSQEYYKEGFTPKFINASLCTHINYEFAILDEANYQMILGDPKLDIQMSFIKETVELKQQNPNLVVLLSMGGWADSTRKYSLLVSDENKRKNFIKCAIQSLKEHKFDGLDIAWEYPNAWQGAIGIAPSDKENFAIFLQEIRNEFNKVGLYLSASCASVKEEIEAAYGSFVPAITGAVHHLNVMMFDLHGPWEHKTGHHAQFDLIPNESYRPHMNMKSSMKVWEELGADKKKINCGIPFYGRSFTLSNVFQHDIGAPTKGIGKAGPNSGEGGYLAFNEICLFLKNKNWKEVDNEWTGTYAFLGDQWVSYDSIGQAVKKTKFIVDNGFGGIMVKDVSADDYKGECFDLPFPLLTALKLELDKRNKFDSG